MNKTRLAESSLWTYERCMIDDISKLIPKLIWSITMLTSQRSRFTSTLCTTIRAESRASTNDRFQTWKSLEPEAVWMPWCIEFWAYPRNSHSKATVLRWPGDRPCCHSLWPELTLNSFAIHYLFFLWSAWCAPAKWHEKRTKPSNIETPKNNSAFQVHSTTDHTYDRIRPQLVQEKLASSSESG